MSIEPKKCLIQGCLNPQISVGLCADHHCWRQHHKKGRIATDPNEFIIEGDICRIILYDKRGNKNGETIIDAEDVERCRPYKWGKHNGRVLCSRLGNAGRLPNFLMDFTSSHTILIDHKDQDPLNNRKKNFRICSKSENTVNRGIQKNNISGYRGVNWDKQNKKWAVGIYCANQHYWVGYFLTKREAALAYNKKAIELFGEFAVLNKVRKKREAPLFS